MMEIVDKVAVLAVWAVILVTIPLTARDWKNWSFYVTWAMYIIAAIVATVLVLTWQFGT